MRKGVLVILSLIILNVSFAEIVNCQISGIKSNKGNILVGVFTSSVGFEMLKTFKSLKLSKKNVKNGILSFAVNLPPAEYGFSILDDDNLSGEMEYNFFGIPNEGFGFSNYFHSGVFEPKFDAFKFLLKKDKSIFIKIKMKYM